MTSLRCVNKAVAYPNEPTIYQRCSFACGVLARLSHRQRRGVFFFDVCSIAEDSFKKRVWSHPARPNTYRKLFSYNLTHVIMCINTQGLFFVQLLKGNMGRHFLARFFEEVIDRLSAMRVRPCFVLDQHRMHLTDEVKRVIFDGRAELFFTPARSHVPQHGGVRVRPPQAGSALARDTSIVS